MRPPPLLLLPRGVNKGSSADKGPGKISPRGPFRGGQREFADLFFSGGAAGLAGLKKNPPLLSLLFAGFR